MEDRGSRVLNYACKLQCCDKYELLSLLLSNPRTALLTGSSFSRHLIGCVVSDKPSSLSETRLSPLQSKTVELRDHLKTLPAFIR